MHDYCVKCGGRSCSLCKQSSAGTAPVVLVAPAGRNPERSRLVGGEING